MNATQDFSGWVGPAFARLLSGLSSESGALRQAWFDQFAVKGLPTIREEAWKYTSLAGLDRLHFESAENRSSEQLGADLLGSSVFPSSHHRFVFIDGVFSTALSKQMLPPSVRVQTSVEPRPLQPASSLVSLTEAMAKTGFDLRIPSGLRIENPIHLIFLSTRGHQAHFPKVNLYLEEAAEALVVEEYLGGHSDGQLSNAVLTAVLENRARLTHVKVQSEGSKTYHLAHSSFNLHAEAELYTLTLALGSLLGREDLQIKLQGSGASARFDGLYMPRKRMHLDHHTEVHHWVPQCLSDQQYRGIADDAGRAVFNGRVIVAEHAQKTDAQQSNANLLLSDQAEIDTKPQLEIFADDVKCSHGATVGALNASELFYLRSRGLNESAARALVTFAFAARALSGLKAPDELLLGLKRVVLNALPHGQDLEGFLK